jgi:uncharacterized protein (DUF1778 family)
MATADKNDARLSIRLPADLKVAVVTAASRAGQTVSQFAALALAEAAQTALAHEPVTELTPRDGDILLTLLDSEAKPNARLIAAAQTYKQHFGY